MKLSKKFIAVPALALVAGLGVAGASASAATQPTPVFTGTISLNIKNLNLDDRNNSSAKGAVVQVWAGTGGPNQVWQVMSDGTIRHNGLCLDVARASKANGAKIDLWSCNGGANQQWVYKAGPNGNGRGVDSEIGVITNPVSGKVLNDARYGGDGTQQVLWTNVGTNNELWLTPICSIYTTPPC